ncbi:Tyramine receptor tyra-2 [Dirofilaria immitis]|nr:Tyramine receptor tyra-2 [Dirofilaria immitis]
MDCCSVRFKSILQLAAPVYYALVLDVANQSGDVKKRDSILIIIYCLHTASDDSVRESRGILLLRGWDINECRRLLQDKQVGEIDRKISAVFTYLQTFTKLFPYQWGALALLVIWTIVANILVFVVLYKNPHLQTVPNLLVANLAFSDLCLGIIVLPLSSIYAIANEWLFTSTIDFAADILCSTASIWNLSIVGLDRYWAITTPMAYMAKRNKRTAAFLILSASTDFARYHGEQFLAITLIVSKICWTQGWKSPEFASAVLQFLRTSTNSKFMKQKNIDCGTRKFDKSEWHMAMRIFGFTIIYYLQCNGIVFIPLIIMFFVYYKIYQTFAKHRARQLYRQQVIKKHIESTILHDLSHVLPADDNKFAKEMEENEETAESDRQGYTTEEVNSTRNICKRQHVQSICKECEECTNETANESSSREAQIIQIDALNQESSKRNVMQDTESHKHQKRASGTVGTARTVITTNNTTVVSENNIKKGKKLTKCRHCGKTEIRKMHLIQSPNTVSDTKAKIASQNKPKIISTAKERRGVKVFGIILGCFAICWTPFFIMYVVVQFCSSCKVDPHIWMFITWLGYSNSAMNPIIYTVKQKQQEADNTCEE